MPAGGRDEALRQALVERLGAERSIGVGLPDGCRRHDSQPHAGLEPLLHCQRIVLRLSDGTPLELSVAVPTPPPLPDHLPWGALLLFVLCIAALAWLAARMATRPLQHLADAADRLDLSSPHEPMAEEGSHEVRAAIRAFNRMQSRIRDDLRERTGMLAAITHDLQTPLTRLRLRLEKVTDVELREKLVGDMTAMQQMLQEGLELARSVDATEARQRLDIDSLLDSLCSDAAESGQVASYVERTAAQVEARPLALRRALSNLVDNAVKYGGGAEVRLAVASGECHIRVIDHGPGIPEDQLEAVFQPFFRLEHSRSRQTGGTGLGLSIARNIIEQHGGRVRLGNRPEGGLEAEVVLPLVRLPL